MSVKIAKQPPGALGPGVPLGTNLGANFQPQHILYYRLMITKGTDDLNAWQFDYPLCGLYQDVDIDSFVDKVRSDDIPPLLPTSDDPLVPTSMTITEPCYVVMELRSDDSTLRFTDGEPAIKTADNHQSQYRKLAHVDAQGNVAYEKSATNCKIIYFGVKFAQLDQDHPYNIYVQYNGIGGSPQSIILKVIDPAIKNRGGDDDARVAIAQQVLDRAIARRRARRKTQKKRAA